MADAGSVTPMMAQFLDIKAAHPDALLFYRMGDFYEMFFEDAVAASAALDIALTKRGKHLDKDIPMCGVPVHSAEGYLLTLIRKGFRVAVCEQLEDPVEAKKRGSKSVVKRDVVRLVTPGTLTEDALLDASNNNYLASFAEVRDQSALAWVDVSTGELRVMACPRRDLMPNMVRLAARELLVVQDNIADLENIAAESGAQITPLSRASFDSTAALGRLCARFNVASLDGFGTFDRAELAALGAIIDYLDLTQKGQMSLLRPPVREAETATMQIDAATRRNLELTKNLNGDRDGSLLRVIDRTATSAGARLLHQRLTSPLTDVGHIGRRLDAVSAFVDDRTTADLVFDLLRQTPDLERALTRLSLGRGGPRDLGAVRTTLLQSAHISASAKMKRPPDTLASAFRDLAGQDDILKNLDDALADELPLMARDGGFVTSGYLPELDELRTLRDQGRSVIAALQSTYTKATGISSLKIKHNNVLGFFIETPAKHAAMMLAAPLSETFIHRQTTANAIRFTTVELSELQSKIVTSAARAIEIEKSVLTSLTDLTLAAASGLLRVASALAEIDVSIALANVAVESNWCRPEIDGGHTFNVVGGRHPVVEQALRRSGEMPFVPNDCNLNKGSTGTGAIWLLTGPNMAGKSTFLRQNALIAILAQMGSYVPASSAAIGMIDQLFSRVGASDDLARGRSTFMVEMVETAAILNQASDRALVILDEIGRGTATYDGLSIAWATLEHLHETNRCRALFATHYHELTALSSNLPNLVNTTVAVREWEGEVVFLHEVILGAADRSYGVQVARLAGLPAAVIDRARLVLDALESRDRAAKAGPSTLVDDLPLFSAAPSSSPAGARGPSPLQTRLDELHPDTLTPKDALSLIYELKDISESGG